MAAWVGNVETIHMLLQRGMQIDALDPEHGATPLSWAAYGSVNRRCETGDYAGAITSLVAAGADIKLPGNKYGTTMLEMADGNPAIQEVLRGLGAQ
jgi:ankyrin repeat protein